MYNTHSYSLSQHIFISRNFVEHQHFLPSEIFPLLTQVEQQAFPAREHEEGCDENDESSQEGHSYQVEQRAVAHLVVRVRVAEI